MAAARYLRTRPWAITVASAVVGMLVVAAGVALWRGPGALRGGGGGTVCAGLLDVGSAGLFGNYFENLSDRAVTLDSIEFGRRLNVRVVANSVIDLLKVTGIGAGEYPLHGDDLFRNTLASSRPLSGYVVPPGGVIEVVMKVYPVDASREGSLRSATLRYSEAGKPFTYESVNTEVLDVRATLDVSACR